MPPSTTLAGARPRSVRPVRPCTRKDIIPDTFRIDRVVSAPLACHPTIEQGWAGVRTMAIGGRDWVLLVTLSLIWGGTFMFNEVALVDMGPLTVVLGRVGVGALALVIWLYASGGRLPADTRMWGAFLVMGVLNNVIPFSPI